MRFLFVDPKLCPPELFALTSGFLQIPPRGGHPCLGLTLPATECVVDFHHQVIAHAGRTAINPLSKLKRLTGDFKNTRAKIDMQKARYRSSFSFAGR